MSLIHPKIISPQQGAFIKWRENSDNINLAQEVIKGIGRKDRGGNIVFKLDLEKAYDRLEWDVLNSIVYNSDFILTSFACQWYPSFPTSLDNFDYFHWLS